MTVGKSPFEEITNERLEQAEGTLALMKQHGADDYANEKFRRKWALPPILGLEGNLLNALLSVIAHERERLFPQLNRPSGGWSLSGPSTATTRTDRAFEVNSSATQGLAAADTAQQPPPV
jgi:hypothetical protein